jgi:hypothetical protein
MASPGPGMASPGPGMASPGPGMASPGAAGRRDLTHSRRANITWLTR